MTKMPLFGEILTYPNNPRVQKSLIAAKYNGLEVKEKILNIGVDNKTKEFLAKFPLGKLPVFQGSILLNLGADGFTLFESSAIASYISNVEGSTLNGKNRKEFALVQQFMAMADNELNPISAAWLYPIFGYYPANDAATAKAKADLQRTLGALNTYLASRTFLVGERVTLADISLVCSLQTFYKVVLEPSFIKDFGHVTRWFKTCVNQPHFKAVLGEIDFCKKMMLPGDLARKPATEEPKAKEQKKEKKEKEPKAKKEVAKEEPTLEEIAAAEAAGPKEKNPLDLLPKSPFVLDAWKRCYSNNDTRPTAIDYFWANYDKEGYSIYKVDYKYNDELTLVFMSSNLVGGFYQRLDRLRKYGFGSMVILGENNANQITGYFVIRGQELPFEVTDTADYESYSFVKVDTDDLKVREDINAVFAWDDVIGGKKLADGKVFK